MSEALQITKTEGGFVTAQAAEIVSDFLRLIQPYILLLFWAASKEINWWSDSKSY